jgi:peptidoglycan/xylan/chitin deacetylase (PgdA/CDA1 family)
MFKKWMLVAGLLFGGSAVAQSVPFDQGMVSINFDDGWATQIQYAQPLLRQYGFPATFYLTSQAIEQNWQGFMTLSNAFSLKNDGHEIAGHTVNHPDLTTISASELEFQLTSSKTWLIQNLNLPGLPQFATPYGRYNAAVLDRIRAHYSSHRTVEVGRNFRDSDRYRLKGNDVHWAVTVPQVRSWIDAAKAEKSWQILLWHEFVPGSVTKTTHYNVNNFQSILDYIRSSGIQVVTMAQGLAMMSGQPPPPPPPSQFILYADALGTGVQDWSWAVHTLTQTAVVHSGTRAIRFEPDSWAGLYFHLQNPASSQTFTDFEFWVNGGSAGSQRVQLVFYNGSTLLGSASVQSLLGAAIPRNAWRKVSVKLANFIPANSQVTEIYWQDASGGNQAPVYIDDVRFFRP